MSYLHLFSVFVWINRNYLITLREDAYVFEKGEKISIFNDIRICVVVASMVVLVHEFLNFGPAVKLLQERYAEKGVLKANRKIYISFLWPHDSLY